MSELPTQRWSPSTVLNIITASNDISCAGINQKGLPCQYNLGGDPKHQARQLLNSMSQRSPRETLNVIPQLAQLCLCQKWHQQQLPSVVAKWKALIEQYASSLEREGTRQIHPPSSRRGNTSDIVSNGGVCATRSSRLSDEEIRAEIKSLSIRLKELRSLLQDVHISEEGSAQTSPSQNSTYLVIHTPQSESELSTAGQNQRSGSPSSRNGWKRVFGRGKQPG